MKRQRQITRKTFILTATIGGILLMAMVIINTYLSYGQTVTATNEAVSEVSSFYLEAMADRRAKTITNLINSNFDQMEKAVDYLSNEKIGSMEELTASIGTLKALVALNRFAVGEAENIISTQDT